MSAFIQRGDVVYIRTITDRRAAIGEVVDPSPLPDCTGVEVQLFTDWFDWGCRAPADGSKPHAGEQIVFSAHRVELVHR